MMDAIDPAEITAKGCRWVRAADGRTVEYSVTGSTRPDARTVVAGYFAVTKEPASWTAAYDSLNVRMINVSLPGLGMSSFHPGRRVADWPKPIWTRFSRRRPWRTSTSMGSATGRFTRWRGRRGLPALPRQVARGALRREDAGLRWLRTHRRRTDRPPGVPRGTDPVGDGLVPGSSRPV